MQPSTELATLIRRSYDALTNGDTSFYDKHLSTRDGVLIIGSDPQEWWDDQETIRRIFKAQVREVGDIQIVASQPQAYSEGNVGWVADQPRLRLPDGTEFSLRTTVVFVREAGDWKVVQQHLSVGVPNGQVVGQELPIA